MRRVRVGQMVGRDLAHQRLCRHVGSQRAVADARAGFRVRVEGLRERPRPIARMAKRAGEQRLRALIHHHQLHAHAARAMAHDRHRVGVAAKGPDVILHPLKRGDHVGLPEIARVGLTPAGPVMEAQLAEAVVERHHHKPVPRETLRPRAARARDEPAAVDGDEHRQVLRPFRREHVEEQAVLDHDALPGLRAGGALRIKGCTGRPVGVRDRELPALGGRVFDAEPARGRLALRDGLGGRRAAREKQTEESGLTHRRTPARDRARP